MTGEDPLELQATRRSIISATMMVLLVCLTFWVSAGVSGWRTQTERSVCVQRVSAQPAAPSLFLEQLAACY